MSAAVAMHVAPEEMGVLVIAMNSMTPADRAVDFYGIKLRWTKAWEKHGGERYAVAVSGGHIESVEVTEARHESVKAAERGDRALADALWQAADSGDEALAGLRSALLGKEDTHAK
jgi:hypothetical protein